eukprot:6190271-Pleurochrysis_carterae.AAC.1
MPSTHLSYTLTRWAGRSVANNLRTYLIWHISVHVRYVECTTASYASQTRGKSSCRGRRGLKSSIVGRRAPLLRASGRSRRDWQLADARPRKRRCAHLSQHAAQRAAAFEVVGLPLQQARPASALALDVRRVAKCAQRSVGAGAVLVRRAHLYAAPLFAQPARTAHSERAEHAVDVRWRVRMALRSDGLPHRAA